MTAFRSLAAVLLILAAAGALLPAKEPAASADDAPAAVDTDNPASEPATDPAVEPLEPASDDAASAASESDAATPAVDEATSEPEPPAADSKKPAQPKESSAKSDGAPTANGKYHLQYKFQAGEVIRWEVVHRAVVDTTIQGSNQTAETRSTSIKMWKVTGVSLKGEVALVHSVESIDMWQKTQGRPEVRYNSQTDDQVPAGYEEIAEAVGVPLTVVTLDRHGNVLSREEKHKQSNPSNVPLTIPLPADPVSIGYSWSVPSDFEVILKGGSSRKIQTKEKFKLEKISDGVATISVETQVVTPLNDPAIEAQLVQRLTNGTLKFDLEQGRVISQQLDLDRRIVGFSGAASSMHYVTRFTEDLMSAGTSTAAKAPKKSAVCAGRQSSGQTGPTQAAGLGHRPRRPEAALKSAGKRSVDAWLNALGQNRDDRFAAAKKNQRGRFVAGDFQLPRHSRRIVPGAALLDFQSADPPFAQQPLQPAHVPGHHFLHGECGQQRMGQRPIRRQIGPAGNQRAQTELHGDRSHQPGRHHRRIGVEHMAADRLGDRTSDTWLRDDAGRRLTGAGNQRGPMRARLLGQRAEPADQLPALAGRADPLPLGLLAPCLR